MTKPPKPPKPPRYAGLDKKLRPLRLQDIPPAMMVGPPNAAEILLQCTTCGSAYPPPWEEKLKFEFSQVKSADGAVWAAAGLSFACPKCGSMNTLKFPQNADTGSIHLYGDEASAWLAGERYVYLYAFVSIHLNLIESATERMRQAKSKFLPAIDPDTWPFHASDVRTPGWRQKHSSPLDTGAVNAVLAELARAMRLIALSQVRPDLVAARSSPGDFVPRFAHCPRHLDACRPLSFCGVARA